MHFGHEENSNGRSFSRKNQGITDLDSGTVIEFRFVVKLFLFNVHNLTIPLKPVKHLL